MTQQLLNLMIIDLLTVKAFVWAILFVSWMDMVAGLHDLTIAGQEYRFRCAVWLVIRAMIFMVAVLILYSDSLEVYVL